LGFSFCPASLSGSLFEGVVVILVLVVLVAAPFDGGIGPYPVTRDGVIRSLSLSPPCNFYVFRTYKSMQLKVKVLMRAIPSDAATISSGIM